MKLQISKKLSYTICILGWLAAAVSIAFLPDSIPISFTDGVPSKFSGSFSIFMWPLVQTIVVLLGENKKMLPEQIKNVFSESQYNWAVFGMILFVFLIELLIIYVACSGV